jgi:AcrR family transcriptional regulator
VIKPACKLDVGASRREAEVAPVRPTVGQAVVKELSRGHIAPAAESKPKHGRSPMKTDDAPKGSEVGSTWQERAIERRLGDARALAVARSTQFMATALELVQESGQASFTLQALADRANLSVRTFYQHFAGKDELLLALYEDVTAQFTEAIREKVEAADGPMGQLEAWCRGVLSRPGSSQEVGGRLVLLYNLSLELEQPEAFAKVWEPHRQLLQEILTACSRAGLIRRDLTVRQLTSLLGSTMTSLGQYNALHGGMDETGLTEEVVWSWCRKAIAP